MNESSDHIVYLLQKILEKMTDISVSLDNISSNIAQGTGAYNLDDVVSHIDQATRDIVGPTGYSLTDLHGALNGIDSNVFELTLISKSRD